MEMSWLAIAGLIYASLVIVKFVIYTQDTLRMVRMMKVMDIHPKHLTRRQFFVSFIIVTAVGLWLTAWFEIFRTGPSYFSHVNDETLYNMAIKMSGD